MAVTQAAAGALKEFSIAILAKMAVILFYLFSFAF
jgi:hypothetical protein